MQKSMKTTHWKRLYDFQKSSIYTMAGLMYYQLNLQSGLCGGQIGAEPINFDKIKCWKNAYMSFCDKKLDELGCIFRAI